MGRFADVQPDPRHAVDFIIETVSAYPHEVTLVAIGPLTNVAVAIRKAPEIAERVKKLVVMGGAIGGLPRGSGNQTPGAEFNFWVDPEAARITLRAGIPTLLCPLNVTRRIRFEREHYDRIVRVSNPTTDLFRTVLGPIFYDPECSGRLEAVVRYGLDDPVTVASIIDETLLTVRPMYIDVDINHGIGYGTSRGYVIGDVEKEKASKNPDVFAGLIQPAHFDPKSGEAGEILVAYDVDPERLTNLIIGTLTG